MTKILHRFQVASGPSFDECHWLGHRYLGPELQWAEAESWVGRHVEDDPDKLEISWIDGFATDLSRGDNSVWVVTGSHILRQAVHPQDVDEWERTATPDLYPTGIWALNDTCVFAWGGTSSGGGPTMAHYDGHEWRPVPVPTFVVAVHGTRDGAVYAVGYKGYIARWTGHAFESVESPIKANLCDVFVASDDALYACGLGGELLRGTQYGWELVLSYTSSLYGVAEWEGRLWVGGGDRRVLALHDDSLEVVKETIHAERFDVRSGLLASGPDVIAVPAENGKWTVSRLLDFEDYTEGMEPGWE